MRVHVLDRRADPQVGRDRAAGQLWPTGVAAAELEQFRGSDYLDPTTFAAFFLSRTGANTARLPYAGLVARAAGHKSDHGFVGRIRRAFARQMRVGHLLVQSNMSQEVFVAGRTSAPAFLGSAPVANGPTCPRPRDPHVIRVLHSAADLSFGTGEACITLRSATGMDTFVVRSARFAGHLAKSWYQRTGKRPSDRAIKATQNAIAEIAEKIGAPQMTAEGAQ